MSQSPISPYFFRAFFLFSSHSLTRCFSCLFVSGLARRRRYCNIRSLSGVALSGATLPLPYGASCRWWLGMRACVNFSRGTPSRFEEADVFWPSLSAPPGRDGKRANKKDVRWVGRNVSLLHGYDGVTSEFEKDKIKIIITYKLPMLIS